MNKIFHYQVTEAEDSLTLGQVLRSGLGLTARQVRQVKFWPDGLWINDQREKDGRMITTRTRVEIGDMIRVCFHEKNRSIAAGEGELAIVYEDEDLLFINKPAGLVSHPAHGHYSDTLANWLAARYAEPVRLIGRLDKDTSGLIGAARSSVAVNRMEVQRRKGQMSREYLALVQGRLTGSGRIDQPLLETRRKPGEPGALMRMVVDPAGKLAQTEYRVWHSWDDCSLVWLRLRTGRTHQIRVHMAWLGHPLVGDSLYGAADPDLPRAALHSWRIRAQQPFTGEPLELTSLPPDDFRTRWETKMQTEYRQYMERLTFPPEAVEALLHKVDARLDEIGQRYMAEEITLEQALQEVGGDYGDYMVFLVGCLPELRRRYAQAGLSEALFWDTMMDLKYKLMECRWAHGQWGNYAAWWYDRFYKMMRFALGRLQFEKAAFEGPDYERGGVRVRPGDVVVNMHIPSAGPLTDELRLDAYRRAYEFFPECRIGDKLVLVCHSWLLDPDYQTFLPGSSNVVHFQRDFDIIRQEKQDDFHDAWRVFGPEAGKAPEDLPRNTSMQRAFADFLAASGKTGVGYGVLIWGPQGRV